MTGPFAALGLPARRDVTDDQVRAAWRRAAAATHPDRPDGGDLAAFAAAAAAYTALRTQPGRAEVLADAAEPAPAPRRAGPAARVRAGRPGRLVLRLLAAAAASTLAVLAVGWKPAALAVTTGALTWLAVTCSSDLAPPTTARHHSQAPKQGVARSNRTRGANRISVQ